jgi:hypothetical protein
MSHGVGHEGGHGDGGNKRIALLISILALVLAIAETLGKGAQTTALGANVEASNLWNFYQAKTIRQTTLRVAGDALEVELAAAPPAVREAAAAQRARWTATVERYESEPSTGEGRRELMSRAKAAEAHRDHALASYHHYELASAALQIAVVLASAQIITGMVFLAWVAGGLGVLGIILCGIGAFAPLAVHLF